MIDQRIANFQIIEQLGAGGMGTVYKAKDLNLKRFVAIKALHPNLLKDENSFKRFKNEAEISAQINHPNVATLYDFVEEDGQSYIIMEFVDGMTLEDLIIKKGGLKKDIVVDYTRQILSGLSAAHKLGVMHRDLKPSNIMISEHGFLKIMDFGIALKETNTRLTTQNKIIGTIDYMAPELFSGSISTPSTDLYAVGIMIYEMLSGKSLFNATSQASMMYQILHKKPKFELRGDKKCFETILNKLLHKSASKRYSSTEKAEKDLLLCSSQKAGGGYLKNFRLSPIVENVQAKLKRKTKLYNQDNIVRVSSQTDVPNKKSGLFRKRNVFALFSLILIFFFTSLVLNYQGYESELGRDLSKNSNEIIASGTYDPIPIASLFDSISPEENIDSTTIIDPSELEESTDKKIHLSEKSSPVKNTEQIERRKNLVAIESKIQEEKEESVLPVQNKILATELNQNVNLKHAEKDNEIEEELGNITNKALSEDTPSPIVGSSEIVRKEIELVVRTRQISIEFIESINSNDFEVGDEVKLQVSEDVIVNDYVIIERGAPVVAKVKRKKKSNIGRLKFGIVFEQVKAVNGEWLDLKYPEYSNINMGNVEFKKGSKVSRVSLLSTKLKIMI